MTKVQKTERTEAITKLKEWLQPGDTVYTILRHVSRSGMQREISCVRLSTELQRCDCHTYDADRSSHWIGNRTPEAHTLDYWVSRALGERIGKNGGIVVGGCGMDMGFSLVYNLSHALYGRRTCSTCGEQMPYDYPTDVTSGCCAAEIVGGYRCLGKDVNGHRRCPSNYHTNAGHLDGGRAAERWDLIHADGYALRHRWL